MKTNTQSTQKRKRKGFTLVELLVVIAIIASLAGLSYGPIMKHLESSARTEAISNVKNIYSAMLGYMAQNDNIFPDEDALEDSETAGGGSAASDYFQLLFDGGHVDDEKYFYHRQGEKMGLASEKPDNDKTLSADDFLANTWKGKAIVLKVDGGAEALKISLSGPLDTTDSSQSGEVEIDFNGQKQNIFDTIPDHGEIITPG